MNGSLAALVAISGLMIGTPGQHTALTIRNPLFDGRPGFGTAVGLRDGGRASGRRSGFGTAAGLAAGQLVRTLAAPAGVTAILVALGTGGSLGLLHLDKLGPWWYHVRQREPKPAIRQSPFPSGGSDRAIN